MRRQGRRGSSGADLGLLRARGCRARGAAGDPRGRSPAQHPADRPELPRAGEHRPGDQPERDLRRGLADAAARWRSRRSPVRSASRCSIRPARTGLGISEFVSLGNKVDVSGNDLLLHWWGDPRTAVIGLYLESFGNPRKFGGLARLVGRTKPILVVKGGRSAGGRRAGASHTAAASTPETAVDALFAQSGVLRMDTVEELVETARVLSVPAVAAWPSARRRRQRGWCRSARGRRGRPARSGTAGAERGCPGASWPRSVRWGAANPVDLGAAASPNSLAASHEGHRRQRRGRHRAGLLRRDARRPGRGHLRRRSPGPRPRPRCRSS